MNKKYIWLVLILLLLVGGIVIYNQQKTNNPNPPPQTNSNISLTSPLPNQLVTSPLHVRGQAKGSWYFEASFPIKLLDTNGLEIAHAAAQAQADWMTEDFVPFKAELNFANPSTDTGTLVLEKDNPSGLPQNAAELRISVKFR